MRKILISLAAAGTALAFATPASAQYFPQPQYGYGGGYGGYAGGYSNFGQARMLQARIDRVQYQIDRISRRGGGMRNNMANRLRQESRGLERQLQFAARNGLNPYEASDISRRVAQLEQRVQYLGANGYGRGYGYNGYGYNGQNGYGYQNGYNGYGYNGQNGYYGDRDGDDDRDDQDEQQGWNGHHDRNDD